MAVSIVSRQGSGSRKSFNHRKLVLAVAAVLGAISSQAMAQTVSGVWTNAAGGAQTWEVGTNWNIDTVQWAGGSGNTADFSTLDATVDTTITQGGITIGTLNFGDTDISTAAGWTIAGSTLTLAGATPTINVGALGTGKVATISSNISGSSGFTKTGAGTLVLSGTNNYTGTVFVQGGVLSYFNVGASPAFSSPNPKFSISNGATATFATNINTTNLTDTLGTIEFTGTGGTFGHTFSSGNSQSLTVVNVNVAGGAVGNISTAARLLLGGSTGTAGTNGGAGTLNLSVPASATGNLTDSRYQIEGNWSTFTGTMNFTGTSATSTAFLHQSGGSFSTTSGVSSSLQNAAINVSASGTNFMALQGRFASGGIIAIGSLSGNANGQIRPTNAAGSGVFSIGNRPEDTEFAGSILDSGSQTLGITKVGANRLTLSGTNLTYTGVTTVTSGDLRFTGTKTGAGATSVAGAGTLSGTGSVAGAISVSGTLAPGASAVGTFTSATTLTLASGSQVNVEFNSTPANDFVIANTLNLNGATVNLFNEGGSSIFSTLGTYSLMQYTTLGATPVISVAPGSQVAGRSYAFDVTGGTVKLTIGVASGPIFWNVDANGTWSTGGNWVGGTPPNSIGATAAFGGGGTEITANRQINVDGNKTVGSINFNPSNPALSYTLAPLSGGTLTLNNDLAPSAITAVSGSHAISVPLVLTSQGVVVTQSTAGTTMAISGGVSGPGSFTVGGSGTVELTGGSGLNSYTGLTSVTGVSTLRLVGADNVLPTTTAMSVTGTLDLNGHSQAVGALSGPGVIVNNGVADSTFAVNGGGTYTGSLNDGPTNKLALVVNGTTALSIGSGAKAFSGGVTVNSGAVLDLGSNNVATAAGTGVLTLSNGTVRTNQAFSLSAPISLVAGTANVFVVNGNAQPASLNSSISGDGTLTFNTNSTGRVLEITGDLSGVTTAGLLQWPTTGSSIMARLSGATTLGLATRFDLGTVAGNVLANINTTSKTYALGSLTGGTGTFLQGYFGGTGNTAITTWSIGGNDLSTTFSGTVRNGDPTSSQERITTITKVGLGTLTFDGSNDTYTGATNVFAGTLVVAGTYEPTKRSPNDVVGVTTSTRLNVLFGAQLQIASTGSAKFFTADSPDSELLVNGALTIKGNGQFDTSDVKTFTGTGSVSVLGGTTTIHEESTTLGALNVTTNGIVVPLAALKVKSLTAATGRLDMPGTSNAPVIVDYTTTSPLTTITSYVVGGRGTANGNGVYDYVSTHGISSPVLAGANGAVGFNKFVIAAVDNADIDLYNAIPTGLSYGTFGTVGVDADSILIRYTYAGDANLDGVINSRDYALINAGFTGAIPASKGWIAGDFNLDGAVNADDYAIIDFGYLSGGNVPLGFGDPISVPEPTSLALLGLGAAGLMGRRRRQA